jgi:hypothetical protein
MGETRNDDIKPRRNPLVRTIFLISGVLSASLGFAGIFIPLLPTTPFLLLASWLFVRSSARMNYWLLHNRLLGPYLRNYQSGRGITLRHKIVSITVLWLTLGASFFFSPPYWWLRLMLALIGTAVTIHLLKFKTIRKGS